MEVTSKEEKKSRISSVGLLQSQRQKDELIYVFLYVQIHTGLDTEMYTHRLKYRQIFPSTAH